MKLLVVSIMLLCTTLIRKVIVDIPIIMCRKGLQTTNSMDPS